jgi:iron(III) transport system substrate-binding protein
MRLGALAACGRGTEAPAPPENVIVEGQAPGYYPAEYSQIIEGSKAEPGSPARSR